MFSKIFITVLLLTCVYTYIFKSTNDNNDTNFEKLPDYFNFESNGTQTIKPNLNIGLPAVKTFIIQVFGQHLMNMLEKNDIKFNDQKLFVDKDFLNELKTCRNTEKLTNDFKVKTLSRFRKYWDENFQKVIEDEFSKQQGKIKRNQIYKEQVEKFIEYVERRKKEEFNDE